MTRLLPLILCAVTAGAWAEKVEPLPPTTLPGVDFLDEAAFPAAAPVPLPQGVVAVVQPAPNVETAKLAATLHEALATQLPKLPAASREVFAAELSKLPAAAQGLFTTALAKLTTTDQQLVASLLAKLPADARFDALVVVTRIATLSKLVNDLATANMLSDKLAADLVAAIKGLRAEMLGLTDPQAIAALQAKVSAFEQSLKLETAKLTAVPHTAAVPLLPALSVFPFEQNTYMRMMVDVGGTSLILETLRNAGVAVQDNRTVERLPGFFSCVNVTYRLETTAEEVATIKALKTPAVAVRFINSRGDVAKALSEAIIGAKTQKFVVIVDSGVFIEDIAKALNSPNVLAIILGHYTGADKLQGEYGNEAEIVLNRLSVVRKVSSKPVLLACSYIQWFNPKPTRTWTAAFGEHLADFDGFAVYNLNRFPMFEDTTRQKICEKIGVPTTKPAVILDFVGTQGTTDDIKASWNNKIDRFLQQIKQDGWRGLVVYSSSEADAQFKDSALLATKPEYLFSE